MHLEADRIHYGAVPDPLRGEWTRTETAVVRPGARPAMSTVPVPTLPAATLPADLAAGPAGATITLAQAKKLIQAMAHEQSFLLLAPPGIGKSDLVFEAAREAGLACRSLLGTQIAPEDVSGVPRIVGERSVFCPPRALLPERPEPFCLFLDELPACAPDVQKAFYSLLLERRLGEHALPKGTWVVAAGNRMQDRALVRAMSSALVNRVTILHLRVDAGEWLSWAAKNSIREDVRAFISYMPDALMREVPAGLTPEPMEMPTGSRLPCCEFWVPARRWWS